MSEKPEDKKNGGNEGNTDPVEKPTEKETIQTKGTHRKLDIKVDRDPEIDSLQKDLAESEAREKALKEKLDTDKLSMEDEKKELQSELDELRAKEAKRALDQFNTDKEALINVCKESKLPDEYLAKIEEKLADPKNLDIVKGFVTMTIATLKKKEDEVKLPKEPQKAPSGKAPFLPPADAESFEDNVKMLDELYDRAYYNKAKYTLQQQREAEDKIKTLIGSMIKSPSWMQLKKGERPPMPNIIECPSCHKTIVGDIPSTCPDCGFNFSKTGDVLKGVG